MGRIDNVKISVIIPVYHTEPLLENCLKSVLNQTWKNIEVIVVDDGSCNGADAIIRSIGDSRVTMIKHECNRGLLRARITGMQHATGDYLGFVDSDDMVSVDFFRLLVTRAEKENADHIIINHQCFSDKSNVVLCERFLKGKYQGIYKGKELFCRMVKENEFLSGAPYHIIKREAST